MAGRSVHALTIVVHALPSPPPSHGDPRTVSAVVKQGDLSNTFRDDELYAPSPDDYVYFTVSTAVVLTGLGLLGWLGLARFKAVRRARRDTAPDRL
jgi:hypothetical protein